MCHINVCGSKKWKIKNKVCFYQCFVKRLLSFFYTVFDKLSPLLARKYKLSSKFSENVTIEALTIQKKTEPDDLLTIRLNINFIRSENGVQFHREVRNSHRCWTKLGWPGCGVCEAGQLVSTVPIWDQRALGHARRPAVHRGMHSAPFKPQIQGPQN